MSLFLSGAAFALLFLYPMTRLFAEGLASAVAYPWWNDSFLWRVIGLTYVQAAASAALAAVVGIPGAFLYAEQRFRGRELFRRLALLSFSFPTILAVLSFASLWGRTGFYGWPAVLLVHVFFNFPLFVRQVGDALATADRSEEKAALSLGASRFRCFLLVTLPRIAPEIRSAFLLAFLFSATSFLVPLTLGGGPRFTTLEVAVYQAVKVDFDPALAVRLAALQGAVGVLAYALAGRRRASAAVGAAMPLYLFRRAAANVACRAVYFSALALLVAAPIVSLVVAGVPSLAPGEWLAPLATSARLAGATALLALLLGFGFAYSGGGGFLAALPLSFSPLVVMLALSRAFPGARELGLWPVAAAQAVLALPFVYRPLRDGVARIPPTLGREAATLGASPLQRLRFVDWPLLRPAILLAALLAVSYSLGEVGTVLLFAGDGLVTLPLAMFRSMARYRFEAAYAGGVVLLTAVAAVQWAAGKAER